MLCCVVLCLREHLLCFGFCEGQKGFEAAILSLANVVPLRAALDEQSEGDIYRLHLFVRYLPCTAVQNE